ncbi:hypothetical protein [Roseimaritima ulvae]|uniref:Uncharacterized protein n=1 Tax=Roseimaritima ulvae TaxID=980254 RepID=A0A5B9QU24_9BACT|nr:hypothetical protein [Roseimaritima ulvae]QEG42538.1 hypothetical protein UC8_45780 [Roseimaritima ulvae]
MDIAFFLAVFVLFVILSGGSIAWFWFVRSQDAERRERERRIAEQNRRPAP